MNFPSLFSLHFPNPNIGTRPACAARRGSVKCAASTGRLPARLKKIQEIECSQATRLICGFHRTLELSKSLFRFVFIFLSVLFSQYCNASLDITQASLSCSASAESNLVPECNCQADKTFLLSFTLKRCSFFPASNIHKAAKLLTCVSGAARLLHSFMPRYAKLHSVYLKNTEHFSTIKKHVIS